MKRTAFSQYCSHRLTPLYVRKCRMLAQFAATRLLRKGFSGWLESVKFQWEMEKESMRSSRRRRAEIRGYSVDTAGIAG